MRGRALGTLPAILGVAGPLVYAIAVIVLGASQTGYSHTSQFMSELGARGSWHGQAMNLLGFQLLGLTLVGFSPALVQNMKESGWALASTLLIAIAGLGFVAVGFFPCDPGCINTSYSGRMHSMISLLPTMGMMFAPIAASISMRTDSRWRAMAPVSLAIGIAAVAVSIVNLPPIMLVPGWKGVFQRIQIGLPLLWVEVMAIRILREHPR